MQERSLTHMREVSHTGEKRYIQERSLNIQERSLTYMREVSHTGENPHIQERSLT